MNSNTMVSINAEVFPNTMNDDTLHEIDMDPLSVDPNEDFDPVSLMENPLFPGGSPNSSNNTSNLQQQQQQDFSNPFGVTGMMNNHKGYNNINNNDQSQMNDSNHCTPSRNLNQGSQDMLQQMRSFARSQQQNGNMNNNINNNMHNNLHNNMNNNMNDNMNNSMNNSMNNNMNNNMNNSMNNNMNNNMNHNNSMNQMNQFNQMNQLNQLNQMNQMDDSNFNGILQPNQLNGNNNFNSDNHFANGNNQLMMGNNQMGNNQMGNNQMGNNQMGNNQMGNNQMGNNQMGNNQMGNSQMGNNQMGNDQMMNGQMMNNQILNNQMMTNQVPHNQIGNGQLNVFSQTTGNNFNANNGQNPGQINQSLDDLNLSMSAHNNLPTENSKDLNAMNNNLPLLGGTLDMGNLTNSLPIPRNNSMNGNARPPPQMHNRKPRRTLSTHGVSSSDAPPSDVNEAMDKLCESMRRSAMSRNLVKQLSGRVLSRTNSGRSVSRTNSGVGLTRVRKQLSSGRSLRRSASAKGPDETGRITPTFAAPIRRASDAKHRFRREDLQILQNEPGRGVFRHNSTASGLLGRKTMLQLDDSSFGAFTS